MTITQQDGTTPYKTVTEDNKTVVQRAYAHLRNLKSYGMPFLIIVFVLEMALPKAYRPTTRVAESSGNFTRVFLNNIHQAEAERQAAIEAELNKIRGHYLAYLKGLEQKFQIKIEEIKNYNEIAKVSYVKMAERANEAFKQIMRLEDKLLHAQIETYQQSTAAKRFTSNVYDLLCGFLDMGCNKSEKIRQEMVGVLKKISDEERTNRFKQALEQRDLAKFVAIDHAVNGLLADFRNIPSYFEDIDIKIRRDLFEPIHKKEAFESSPSPSMREAEKVEKQYKSKLATAAPTQIVPKVVQQKEVYRPQLPTLQSMIGQSLTFKFLKSGENFSIDLYPHSLLMTYTSGKQRYFDYKLLNANKLCLVNPQNEAAYLGCKIFQSYNGKIGWWSIAPDQNYPSEITAVLVSHKNIKLTQ
jgi:hypothetical protein